jgi:hypothetical protein
VDFRGAKVFYRNGIQRRSLNKSLHGRNFSGGYFISNVQIESAWFDFAFFWRLLDCLSDETTSWRPLILFTSFQRQCQPSFWVIFHPCESVLSITSNKVTAFGL